MDSLVFNCYYYPKLDQNLCKWSFFGLLQNPQWSSALQPAGKLKSRSGPLRLKT